MLTAHYLSYAATRRFSPLVLDYLDGADSLQDFYSFRPDGDGIAGAIAQRMAHPIDRDTLADVLYSQYRHLPLEAKTEAAIEALRDEHTFTICTAHQPNLATGYLYFVYKILHAIRLAQELQAAHPEYRFVPVYYMGSEDADLEELGTFRIGDRKFVWDGAGQKGAVGRMSTASLMPLLKELFSLLGPPGPFLDRLQVLLMQAYAANTSIAQATQYLVHGLFGRYGLLVLDPDSAALKRSFIPVMREDLLDGRAERLVREAIGKLDGLYYKAQAHPRPVNLFYLNEGLRERIERNDNGWQVIGTDISWDEAALLAELDAHPERFSPNVMLRPLYQETILPNVAFIGGGAEVAYWLQLRSLFQHHNVFYPAILLRQSVMWISGAQHRLLVRTGLSHEALFAPKEQAAKAYISKKTGTAWRLTSERDTMEVLFSALREKAATIDPTLLRSADAALAKMKRQLDALEGKMLRGLKRRDSAALADIARLQEALFPGGGLAERVENFIPYYLEHGASFFEELMRLMEPLRSEFLIVSQ